MKKVFSFVLLSLLFLPSVAQDSRSHWVDSVFTTLSKDQKIGQLFMVPVSTHADDDTIDELADLVKDGDVGGYYIIDGGPISHVRLFNRLQKISKVPLFVGLQAEWGLSQTLDSTMGFQKPMAASAWKNDSLIHVWAMEIARQMKMLGFNLNLAPNADDEIFSGDYLRYFSNDQQRVAHNTVAFTKSMQAEGVLAVTKHLPRRAMVENKDSSLVLNFGRIDTAGFYILQKLIENNVDGILTSYLHFSLQNEKGIVPASLSQIFISEILKQKLNFHGLVFTEVKNFQKTAGKIRDGEAENLAFETGNDILMAPLDVTAGIKSIAKRLKKDKLLQQQLDVSVKKILAAKYDAGLNQVQPINEDNLLRKLHSPESYLLKRRLAEAAVTVVSNQDNFLPIRTLENNSFRCISIGKDAENEFSHYLKKYTHVELASIKNIQDTVSLNIKPGETVIVGVFRFMTSLERDLASWIKELGLSHKVIVVHFGNPLTLEPYMSAAALIAAYTDQDDMMTVIPQTIFGALPATGVLPVKLRDIIIEPLSTPTNDRLSYTVPEAAGLDSRTLEKIKNIMKEAIDIGATPGCQVIVIKDGKVVYQQSEGTLTYQDKTPQTDETIYDLASLTKVSATLQATMFMYEKGLIDINKKASMYLPILKNTNKKDITIIDMLTHQSGLIPFMPLWNLTVKDSVYMPYYYSKTRDAKYPLQIGRDLYATNALPDSVWSWIVNSKMQDKIPRTQYPYRYSDLGFMMLKEMAEKILNQPLDEFLHQNLYEPLGAYTTGFKPLERFSETRIAPTEVDKIYRRSIVTGTVHDERAAMMGGVSGHAGLFSTGDDLAKVGQMLLQDGHYGGTIFFKPETIRYFSGKQFMDSRRGLGWDKPVQNDWSSPTSLQASMRTFGHTGFTGTCMWIDPEFNLVYIFLSNRVFPDRNNKLLTANIRPRIQDVIYQAIFNYCSNKN